MKNKITSRFSNKNITSIINNSKKSLLIRKNGILFILMKVYLIVPDYLKNLIRFKNNFYIYYPIKNSDFLQNKNIKINSKYNKYKICLTKRDIIDEVKFFLNINKNSTMYDFDLYNQNLGIIKPDYHLTKMENINNNIIYIKIKLNKEHSEIKPYNDIPSIPKIIKLKNNNSKFYDFIIKLKKKHNSELNLKKVINDTFMTINPEKKIQSKKNYVYFSRNSLMRKYKNNNMFIKYSSNKIDKDTNTDDLTELTNALNENKISKYDFATIDNYKNSLINLKNVNKIAKNLDKVNLNKKNLSSLDYFPDFRDKKPNNFKLNLINKYKTIRTIKRKEAFFNKNNTDNSSIYNIGSYSYQDRKKFVKSLYESNNSSVSRNKKNLHLSQPNIIKSYMEIYKCNLNNNKIQSKNND